MKRIKSFISIILLLILSTAAQCLSMEPEEFPFVTIENKGESVIDVVVGFNYPDTSFQTVEPYFKVGVFPNQTGTIQLFESRKDTFKKYPVMQLFFIDPSYPTEADTYDQMVDVTITCRQITYDQMVDADWTVTYP